MGTTTGTTVRSRPFDAYRYRWQDCQCQTDLSGICLHGATPRNSPNEHDVWCPLKVPRNAVDPMLVRR